MEGAPAPSPPTTSFTGGGDPGFLSNRGVYNRSMELQFECGCGDDVSVFTRGDTPEISSHFRCEECGTTYALTLTVVNAQYE